MAARIIVAHVDHDKTSLTAAITKVLADMAPSYGSDFEIVVAEPEVREIEFRPMVDIEIPTAREFFAAGIRSRGIKRTDIPRPKDQYHQRRKGFRP